MSSAEKQKPSEVLVSWDDFQAMKRDRTMIVVMALPADVKGMFYVTFWSKEDGELPSWIIDQKAA
jgi:hypothetical protein